MLTKNKLAAAAMLTLLLGTAPAHAADDERNFSAACNGNPSLLEQTQNDLEGLSRLCDCVEAEFEANVSPTDLALLSADLAGTATDQEKMAHETWEDLSAYASETLSTCLVIEGFADGYDPGAS